MEEELEEEGKRWWKYVVGAVVVVLLVGGVVLAIRHFRGRHAVTATPTEAKAIAPTAMPTEMTEPAATITTMAKAMPTDTSMPTATAGCWLEDAAAYAYYYKAYVVTSIDGKPFVCIAGEWHPVTMVKPPATSAAEATPTPEPMAMPTTVTTFPLQLEGATCNQFGCTLPEGWKGQVPVGTTCSGDLVIEGENLFDNRAETGLVVYFQREAEVLAPWGAHCRLGDFRNIKKTQLLAAGCSLPQGCKEVKVVVWKK